MMNKKSDYREYLMNEFESRCQRNRSYSLRAFARDLRVSPGKLSQVLNFKQGFSAHAAAKVSKRLNLSKEEREMFCTLVDSVHARSPLLRKSARDKVISTRKENAEMQQLREDQFRIISNWYHYAILELTSLADFKNDNNWIANRLGITKVEVERAKDRLFRLGLLEEKSNDRLLATSTFTWTHSDQPSMALKNHHTQLLKKAEQAVFEIPVEDRESTSITLSCSRDKISEAKALIKKFRNEFMKKIGASEKKDSVYCLAMHFFSLDKNDKGEIYDS